MPSGCCSTSRRRPPKRRRRLRQRRSRRPLRPRRRKPTIRNSRMSLASKTLKLCSCNGTLALDGKRLGEALKTGKPVTVHRELCRKESTAYQSALADPDVIVACTQEAPLFGELAAAAQSQARLSFVNIRESAGWSAEGGKAMPKIAALL